MSHPLERTDLSTTRQLLMRLWREWVRQYRFNIVIILALMVVVSLLSGAYPLLIGQVFNTLDSESADWGWGLPFLIFAAAAIKSLAMYMLARRTAIFKFNIITAIQRRMASHLIDADLSLISSVSTGNFINRMMGDTALLHDMLTRLLNNLIRDGLQIIVQIAVMIWFDWLLALITLIIYPIAVHPIIVIGQRQKRHSRELQEQRGEATSLLNETLQAGRMVRTYGLENHEKQRVTSVFDRIKGRAIRLGIDRGKIGPILETFGGLTIAIVIFLIGWRIIEGGKSIGDMIGFFTALIMLATPARAFGLLNSAVQQAVPALSRIFTLLDIEPTVITKPQAKRLDKTEGSIVFDKVCFTYDQVPAVNDISFSASQGEIIALVGPSGGGKSTIINLIPRLYDPTTGKITLDGYRLDEIDLIDLRKNAALVSQDTLLFNDTIAANIAFGKLNAPREDIERAATAAAADQFIAELPQGYDTVIGEHGNILSGGQRQRIAIARAILRDAPILLLDEPTSALDANTEHQIQESILALAKGKTTIIVTHRLAMVQNADHILVIDHGQIVEEGNHETLLAKNGLYANLCASQTLA